MCGSAKDSGAVIVEFAFPVGDDDGSETLPIKFYVPEFAAFGGDDGEVAGHVRDGAVRVEDAVEAEDDVRSKASCLWGQQASSRFAFCSHCAGETPTCPTGKMRVLHHALG